MPSFHLEIISRDQVEFSGEAESLVAPGEAGYFGVLANHAPMLSTLREGELKVREASGAGKQYHVLGGFLEVHRNKVIVLVRELAAQPAA